MPIYEYECTGCGHRIEILQRLTDPPPEGCEKCGAELKRLLSAPAFQFKGSGWYVTDYAGKGRKEEKGKGEGGDAKPPAKEGGGKADSGGDSGKSAGASSKAAEKAD